MATTDVEVNVAKLNICLSRDNAEDMANVFWRDYREERSEKADEKVMALV